MSAIDTNDPSLDEEDEDVADTKIPVKGKLAPKSASQDRLDRLLAKQKAEALAKLARAGDVGLHGAGGGAGSIVDLGDGSGQGAGSVVDLGDGGGAGGLAPPPPAPPAPPPAPLSHDPALARALLAQKQHEQARLQGWNNLKRDLTDPGAPPGEDPRALAASNPDRYGGINPTMRPVLPVTRQVSDASSSDDLSFPNGMGLGLHAPAPGMGDAKSKAKEAALADIARERESNTIQARIEQMRLQRQSDLEKDKQTEENERARLGRESRERVAAAGRDAAANKPKPPVKPLTPGEQRQADQNAREADEDRVKDLDRLKHDPLVDYEDVDQDLDPLKEKTRLHPSDRAAKEGERADNEAWRREQRETEEGRRREGQDERIAREKAAAAEKARKDAEDADLKAKEQARHEAAMRSHARDRAHAKATAEVFGSPKWASKPAEAQQAEIDARTKKYASDEFDKIMKDEKEAYDKYKPKTAPSTSKPPKQKPAPLARASRGNLPLDPEVGAFARRDAAQPPATKQALQAGREKAPKESYPPSAAPGEDQQRAEHIAELRAGDGGDAERRVAAQVAQGKETYVEVDGQKTTATDLAGKLLDEQPNEMARRREIQKMRDDPKPYEKRGINVAAILEKYGG